MPARSRIVFRSPVPQRDTATGVNSEPVKDYDLIAEATGAQVISSASLAAPWPWFVRKQDHTLASALAAFRARSDTDAFFTTGEELAFRLLPLLQAAGWKGQLHCAVHAAHAFKARTIAGLLGSRCLGGYYAVAEQQRRALVEQAGLPASRVHFLRFGIDTAFYDPSLSPVRDEDGYVFACGLENRDYATLIAAAPVAGMPIRIQASGYHPEANADDRGLPENVAINRTRISYSDLRSTYAGARLVAVPLNAVPYAAGVTGLLEAMSMGKAVVVTDSPGLEGYLDLDSVLRVPGGDPARMAAALDMLWRDPAACAEMGRANRDWVVCHADVRDYATFIARKMLEG